MNRRLFAVTAAIAWLSLPLEADVLVRKQVEADAYAAPVHPESVIEPVNPPPDGTTIEIWTDGRNVRRDEPGASFIVRPEDGALYVVFHGDRSFVELSWPPDYEKVARESPMTATLLESAPELLPFESESGGSREEVQAGSWSALREESTVSNGMGRRFRVVLDHLPEGSDGQADAEILQKAFSLDHAISKLSRAGYSPFDAVVDGPEPVVGWLLAEQQPEVEVKYGERVVEIEVEGGTPDGGYEPPADYAEIPFSARFLGMR